MITKIALVWKLRRIAAGYRQQDIAARIGVSSTRYSTLERGEAAPIEWEIEAIEQVLPQLTLISSRPGGRPQNRQDIPSKKVPEGYRGEGLDG